MFLLDFCDDTKNIWKLIGSLITVMKIVIPIIIILLATIDLGKAVMAGEEKEIKEAQKMLIKRLIYGVAIFFVVTIVQAVFNLVSETEEGKGSTNSTCWRCVADGKC